MKRVTVWKITTFMLGGLIMAILIAVLDWAAAAEQQQHVQRYSQAMPEPPGPYHGKTNPKTNASCCNKNDCWAHNVNSDWHVEMSDDGKNYLVTYTFTRENVPLAWWSKYEHLMGEPVVFEYPADQVMASWDANWHICVWGFASENGPEPKCLFVPLSF